MRIFVDKIEGVRHSLTGEDHRHLAYSLRCKIGDKLTLCPQDGYDYECVITRVSADQTVAEIVEKRLNESEPQIELTVYGGVMSKSDKMDLIAQKLTELGASFIYPLMTRYVQAKAQSVRTERLNKICAEAAKQSGRGVIPKVYAPAAFDEMIAALKDYDLIVFPYERERELSLKKFLRSRAESLEALRGTGKRPKVAVIVGSEGGFSEAEADALAAAGVHGVTIGPRILRAETANIAVAGAVMYELDQWERTREAI